MASAKAMVSGKLYGVGVGPGDPELMTVKAWRLISTARIIAYLCANGKDSTARDIAKPFITEGITEITIDMPMRVEREPAQAAYDKGAKEIAAHLEQGRDVVMLCEGDPFFYGSFMYVFERLADKFKTIVVPGVTSITAAAAAIGRPLVERDEVLKVLPATLDAERLLAEIKTASAAAIIKVGRHFGKVKAILAELHLLDKATAIENATHENQIIRPLTDIEGDTLPYFTTIIVKSRP
ncbi:MAG: precorrin-2 C(20)-methyltransferase [Aestuariivirga sp.]